LVVFCCILFFVDTWLFLCQHITLLSSWSHTNEHDGNYVYLHLFVYVTSLLCDKAGDCVEAQMYVYSGFQRKCAENTCIMGEYISHTKWHKSSRSVTVLSEILKFYLLLYATYFEECYPVNAPSSIRFIYCNCLGLDVTIYSTNSKKQTSSFHKAL
jgi:hypothetical protein